MRSKGAPGLALLGLANYLTQTLASRRNFSERLFIIDFIAFFSTECVRLCV